MELRAGREVRSIRSHLRGTVEALLRGPDRYEPREVKGALVLLVIGPRWFKFSYLLEHPSIIAFRFV